MNDISRTVLAVTAGGAFTISAASAPSDGQQRGETSDRAGLADIVADPFRAAISRFKAGQVIWSNQNEIRIEMDGRNGGG
jgi:hypothetical protein